MSAQAAAASTPAGQATLPGITPPVETKPAASVVAPPAEGKEEVKKTEGEPGTQGGESKDGKTTPAAKLEIKLPDGAKVDAEALKEFTAVAEKLGLDGEKATEIVKWQLARVEAESQRYVDAVEKEKTAWVEQIKADKEFGGENLEKTNIEAMRAVRHFGSEPLVKALEELGVNNHPELVRTFARIGRAMAEDNSFAPSEKGGKPADDRNAELRIMYPSMFNADGSPKKK